MPQLSGRGVPGPCFSHDHGNSFLSLFPPAGAHRRAGLVRRADGPAGPAPPGVAPVGRDHRTPPRGARRVLVKATCIGGTTDISAGQLIDRTGKRLGLAFPAGKAVDALSREAAHRDSFRVKVHDASLLLLWVGKQDECPGPAGDKPRRHLLVCPGLHHQGGGDCHPPGTGAVPRAAGSLRRRRGLQPTHAGSG